MIYYVTVRKLTMDFFRAVPTDTYIYMLQKRIRNKPCRLTHDLNHENAPAKFSIHILSPEYNTQNGTAAMLPF